MVLGDVGTYNIFVRDYTIIQLHQSKPLYCISVQVPPPPAPLPDVGRCPAAVQLLIILSCPANRLENFIYDDFLGKLFLNFPFPPNSCHSQNMLEHQNVST